MYIVDDNIRFIFSNMARSLRYIHYIIEMFVDIARRSKNEHVVSRSIDSFSAQESLPATRYDMGHTYYTISFTAPTPL